MKFQSTLSVRRATILGKNRLDGFEFQSTLSVRRATYLRNAFGISQRISIHALRKESDHPP